MHRYEKVKCCSKLSKQTSHAGFPPLSGHVNLSTHLLQSVTSGWRMTRVGGEKGEAQYTLSFFFFSVHSEYTDTLRMTLVILKWVEKDESGWSLASA